MILFLMVKKCFKVVKIFQASNIGSMEFVTNESKTNERSKEDTNSRESNINYPVGKPLEVSSTIFVYNGRFLKRGG